MENELVLGIPTTQVAKKAPAAKRRPIVVAQMPVTLRAPLLPPLKEPVGMVVEEVEEDVLVNGVDFWDGEEIVEVERPELRENVGKVRVMNRYMQHLHGRWRASSRGGQGRGKRGSGRLGWIDFERASLGKDGVDVPYRGSLEGVS